MFEGFEQAMIDTGEAMIRVRHGGRGPPVLLVHGIPGTHVMRHKIAPRPVPHGARPCSKASCLSRVMRIAFIDGRPGSRGGEVVDQPVRAARYLQLDERQIIQTLERLRDRIGERFPQSGLSRVSEELLAVANDASLTVAYLRRPNWLARGAAATAIVGMLAVLGILAITVRGPTGVTGLADVIQTIEAGINDVVFFGIAIYFLLTVETRLKRRRALRTIRQLRSLAHIVDMHQLTKDPERLISAHPDTPASPTRTMTASELGRYLDYCSELLSVTSKIAALLVQYFDDPVVLGAVNEIETLTTGLSGKIWQKITILERISVPTRPRPTPT
jgi:hypothetical protein